MTVGTVGRDPALRRTCNKTVLDQVRLVNVLQGPRVFGKRRGKRIETDRAAVEFLNDRIKDPPVAVIQAEFVDLQDIQRLVGDLPGNGTVPADFGKITYPL